MERTKERGKERVKERTQTWKRKVLTYVCPLSRVVILVFLLFIYLLLSLLFVIAVAVVADLVTGVCVAHPRVPLVSLPPHQRWYSLDDSFPPSREERKVKAEVNQLLSRFSDGLANPRCLVLDGASGNTSRSSVFVWHLLLPFCDFFSSQQKPKK